MAFKWSCTMLAVTICPFKNKTKQNKTAQYDACNTSHNSSCFKAKCNVFYPSSMLIKHNRSAITLSGHFHLYYTVLRAGKTDQCVFMYKKHKFHSKFSHFLPNTNIFLIHEGLSHIPHLPTMIGLYFVKLQ